MKRLESITIHGLYEWTRVLMGTTLFPTSHSNSSIGLIYLFCELYIGDVLIDGADEVAFVNNVRQVFARFRKHKIIVNPKKTQRHVGHLVR